MYNNYYTYILEMFLKNLQKNFLVLPHDLVSNNKKKVLHVSPLNSILTCA